MGEASSSSRAVSVREVTIKVPVFPNAHDAKHALGDSISQFAARISDIAWAGQACVPHAQKLQIRLVRKIAGQRRSLLRTIESTNGTRQAEAVASLLQSMRFTDRIVKSEMPITIVRGLFIELFCEFDNFVGNLIRAISLLDESRFYHLKREVTIGELKSLRTVDDLRDDLLEKEIEGLRRESYPKQFQFFEKEYDLTLTKFSEWPSFVEASQRRNLFAHAGGVVSDQYRQVCFAAGIAKEDLPASGTQLSLDPEYFFQSCGVVERTGVMLGYTLWRKLFPADSEKLDSHLNEVIYNLLLAEDFETTIKLCDFGLSHPFCKATSNKSRRIRLVNKAIALQRVGRRDDSLRIIESEDWSDTLRDFRLAIAVLKGEYGQAAELMRKIGKEGELVTEGAYRNWPLFWAFRKTNEFLVAYKTIFGYSFSDTVTKDAEMEIGSADAVAATSNGERKVVRRRNSTVARGRKVLHEAKVSENMAETRKSARVSRKKLA